MCSSMYVHCTVKSWNTVFNHWTTRAAFTVAYWLVRFDRDVQGMQMITAASRRMEGGYYAAAKDLDIQIRLHMGRSSVLQLSNLINVQQSLTDDRLTLCTIQIHPIVNLHSLSTQQTIHKIRKRIPNLVRRHHTSPTFVSRSILPRLH